MPTPQDPAYNPITIPITIDNKGDRGTTIHSTHLLFDYKGKSTNVKDDHQLSLLIQPHSTLRHYFSYFIKRNEIMIEDNIENAKLVIDYTHGKKQLDIAVIKKFNLS